MALSFNIRLTWKQFWNEQQNNPNCELPFLYDGKIYFLHYETYQKKVWGIYEAGEDPSCRGLESFGKCLAENYDEIQNHHNHPTDEEWKSALNSCYKVLTTPIWNGNSFKDVIENIIFE